MFGCDLRQFSKDGVAGEDRGFRHNRAQVRWKENNPSRRPSLPEPSFSCDKGDNLSTFKYPVRDRRVFFWTLDRRIGLALVIGHPGPYETSCES